MSQSKTDQKDQVIVNIQSKGQEPEKLNFFIKTVRFESGYLKGVADHHSPR